MSVLRNQPKGARIASFGLGLCVFALMPTEIGYQDIASLLARQPGVAERWQNRVFSSAGTIQVATFSFGRPIGTSSPQTATYRLASLDHQGIDITGSVTRNPLVAPPPRYQAADFPKVDRTLKGDRLVVTPPPPAETAGPAERAPAVEDPANSNALVKGAKTAETAPSVEPAPLDPELQAALSAPPLAQFEVPSLETRAAGRSQGRSACTGGPARCRAVARWLLLQDLEPVFWLVARLARKHRALAARRRTGHRHARRNSRSRHEGDGLTAGRCRRAGAGRRDR